MFQGEIDDDGAFVGAEVGVGGVEQVVDDAFHLLGVEAGVDLDRTFARDFCQHLVFKLCLVFPFLELEDGEDGVFDVFLCQDLGEALDIKGIGAHGLDVKAHSFKDFLFGVIEERDFRRGELDDDGKQGRDGGNFILLVLCFQAVEIDPLLGVVLVDDEQGFVFFHDDVRIFVLAQEIEALFGVKVLGKEPGLGKRGLRGPVFTGREWGLGESLFL